MYKYVQLHTAVLSVFFEEFDPAGLCHVKNDKQDNKPEEPNSVLMIVRL